MIIKRIQGGVADSIETHKSTYFKQIYSDLPILKDTIIIDPFARNCELATITNDINPDTNANYCMDALDFLCMLPSEMADIVIFDPPFSRTQNKRKYGEIANVYTKPGYVKKCMLQIIRILKPNGVLMKLGYNSTRHLPALELNKLYIVNFGGNRNDVIVSIWINKQKPLSYYMKLKRDSGKNCVVGE